MKPLPSLLILSAMLTAALGLPMALIGCEKKSPLPGEAAQDPAPRIEPSDDGAALLKRKMAGITIPEIAMNNASLEEALDFLHKSSIPQDAADSGKGGNGIDFVLLKSALPDSREPLLIELKKAIRDQEDKVEERRKIMVTLARTKNIIPRTDPTIGDQGRLDEDQEANYVLKLYNDIEAEEMRLQSRNDSLLKYDSEKLLIYASAGLDLPDNIIKTLYPQYLEIKREIDGLMASGVERNHPTIISKTRILEATKDDLNEGVVHLRTRLEGQLEMAKERLAKVEIKKTEIKREALERYIDTQDYIDAKRDLETDLALLENMKLRLMNEEITARLEIPHRVTLNLRQAPFEDVLKYIVQQCGLSYAIHSSAIVVGTADEIAALDGRSR